MKRALVVLASLVLLATPAHAATLRGSGDCTQVTATVYNLDTGYSYTHLHGPRGPFYFLQYPRYQKKVTFTFEPSGQQAVVVFNALPQSTATVTGPVDTTSVSFEHKPTVLLSGRHWGSTTELPAPVVETGSVDIETGCV